MEFIKLNPGMCHDLIETFNRRNGQTEKKYL